MSPNPWSWLRLLLSITWLWALPSSAQTLKDLLSTNSVPFTAFTAAELGEAVQGASASNGKHTMLAYRELQGDRLVGPVQVLSYTSATGAVLRGKLPLAQDDICLGSLGSPRVVGGDLLISTEISPSAQCLLVVDCKLHLTSALYGFDPQEVYSNHIVLIEDMIHFAPVHPERLQLADLRTGQTTELYPPLHDPLRAQLIREHGRHLPSPATCMRMNDPCDPAQFDEDIRALNTNGRGRLAFLAVREANHPTKPGSPPETVASQQVLYLYQHEPMGWRYCEVPIEESRIATTASLIKSGYSHVARRCQPKAPVLPDMSTAPSNPFLSHIAKPGPPY